MLIYTGCRLFTIKLSDIVILTMVAWVGVLSQIKCHVICLCKDLPPINGIVMSNVTIS